MQISYLFCALLFVDQYKSCLLAGIVQRVTDSVSQICYRLWTTGKYTGLQQLLTNIWNSATSASSLAIDRHVAAQASGDIMPIHNPLDKYFGCCTSGGRPGYGG